MDITLREGNRKLDISMIPILLPLTGSIVPGYIWHEPLVGWETAFSGREIPLNKEINLAPGWLNDSEVNIVGHIELSITYPDSSTTMLSAILNQDKEAAPRSGYHVQFAPFLSSQEGTYTLVATLSSGGQVLDSVTFTLIVPVYTGATFSVPALMTTSCPFSYTYIWDYYRPTCSCPITNMGSQPAIATFRYKENMFNPGVWITISTPEIPPGETWIWLFDAISVRNGCGGFVLNFEGDWEGNNISIASF